MVDQRNTPRNGLPGGPCTYFSAGLKALLVFNVWLTPPKRPPVVLKVGTDVLKAGVAVGGATESVAGGRATVAETVGESPKGV